MHDLVPYEVSQINESEQYETRDVDVANCYEPVSWQLSQKEIVEGKTNTSKQRKYDP